MKKTTIWLLIAALLVFIGGVISVAARAVNHWRIDSLTDGGSDFVTETVEITETFDRIELHSETEDIQFVLDAGKPCRVVFYDRPEVERKAVVENGVLQISAIDTRQWYEQAGISFTSPTITVYLPEAAYTALTIDEDTGAVELPKDFRFGSIVITASTGAIRCEASSDGQLQLEASTGDLHLEGVTAASVSLTVSTGHVEAKNVACSGPMELRVSTGDAVLTDVTCGDLRSTGSTGALQAENLAADGSVTIERSTGTVQLSRCDAGELQITTDTGEVTLDRCDAGALQISTDTGDVTGTLRSGKLFSAKSGTGRVDVPAPTPGGPCTIRSDTGDIQISISD